MTSEQLLDKIAMGLGGRIAEELVFNQFTTGAANDLKQVTTWARRMITEWGMSERLGTVAYVDREEPGFLGATHYKDYSEATAKEIDDEVRQIIHTQYQRARKVLEENRDKLQAMADALLERETLDRDEIELLMKGEPLPPRERIVIPSYADKRREAKEKRKGSVFQPRPQEIPSAG